MIYDYVGTLMATTTHLDLSLLSLTFVTRLNFVDVVPQIAIFVWFSSFEKLLDDLIAWETDIFSFNYDTEIWI